MTRFSHSIKGMRLEGVVQMFPAQIAWKYSKKKSEDSIISLHSGANNVTHPTLQTTNTN